MTADLLATVINKPIKTDIQLSEVIKQVSYSKIIVIFHERTCLNLARTRTLARVIRLRARLRASI